MLSAVICLTPGLALAQNPSSPDFMCPDGENEVRRIIATSGLAQRKGRDLTITLSNGRKKIFRDKIRCKDNLVRSDYSLAGFHPGERIYLIYWTDSYEDRFWYLWKFDQKNINGKPFTLDQEPVFSPDGLRMVVNNCSFQMICPIGTWKPSARKRIL